MNEFSRTDCFYRRMDRINLNDTLNDYTSKYISVWNQHPFSYKNRDEFQHEDKEQFLTRLRKVTSSNQILTNEFLLKRGPKVWPYRRVPNYSYYLIKPLEVVYRYGRAYFHFQLKITTTSTDSYIFLTIGMKISTYVVIDLHA